MWHNKQNGILPNQYHYTYQNGDTIIYPEHIADIATIDKMYAERMKKEQQKAESKQAAKHPTAPTNPKGKGFYGRKFTYHK